MKSARIFARLNKGTSKIPQAFRRLRAAQPAAAKRARPLMVAGSGVLEPL